MAEDPSSAKKKSSSQSTYRLGMCEELYRLAHDLPKKDYFEKKTLRYIEDHEQDEKKGALFFSKEVEGELPIDTELRQLLRGPVDLTGTKGLTVVLEIPIGEFLEEHDSLKKYVRLFRQQVGKKGRVYITPRPHKRKKG